MILVSDSIFSPDIFHDLNEGVILKFFKLVFRLNNETELKNWEDNYAKCGSFLKHCMLTGIGKGKYFFAFLINH